MTYEIGICRLRRLSKSESAAACSHHHAARPRDTGQRHDGTLSSRASASAIGDILIACGMLSVVGPARGGIDDITRCCRLETRAPWTHLLPQRIEGVSSIQIGAWSASGASPWQQIVVVSCPCEALCVNAAFRRQQCGGALGSYRERENAIALHVERGVCAMLRMNAVFHRWSAGNDISPTVETAVI